MHFEQGMQVFIVDAEGIVGFGGEGSGEKMKSGRLHRWLLNQNRLGTMAITQVAHMEEMEVNDNQMYFRDRDVR